MGKAASIAGWPPNGSRYVVSTAPSSPRIRSASARTASSSTCTVSCAVSPIDLAPVFFRRRTVRFFAICSAGGSPGRIARNPDGHRPETTERGARDRRALDRHPRGDLRAEPAGVLAALVGSDRRRGPGDEPAPPACQWRDALLRRPPYLRPAVAHLPRAA